MDFIKLLIILEMLVINQTIFVLCCQRKHSRLVTYSILVAFSVLMILFISVLSPKEQNGNLIVLGFLYLIPFSFLYKGKISRLFITMCMCWIYSIGIGVLAVQCSKLIPEQSQELSMLLIQTALYVVTVFPFFKWVTPKYMFILENLERFRNCGRYFNLVCCLHFVTMLVLNYTFFQGEGSILKVLSVLLISAVTFLTYTMLYRMVSDSICIGNLQKDTQHDALTGLANRPRLFRDLQEKIDEGQAFSILFIDLDRFKEINDRYGHMIGDRYLRHFADICREILGDEGKTYRFGGDEFVVLYPGKVPEETVERLRTGDGWEKGAPCPFNEASVGHMVCRPPFPDVEEILHQADRSMYQTKGARAE